MEQIDESYAVLCRYVLWMLKSTLLDDAESRALLESPPEGFVSVRRK